MRQLRSKLAGPSSGRRAVSDGEGGGSVVQCHVTVSVSTPTPSLLTSFSELTILATERDLVMA